MTRRDYIPEGGPDPLEPPLGGSDYIPFSDTPVVVLEIEAPEDMNPEPPPESEPEAITKG